MRIRILGPGAVGILVGGLLAQAGHEITFIGRRPDHLFSSGNAARLVLPDRWMRFRPHGYTNAIAAGGADSPVDLVIVALRRDHLRELIKTPHGAAIVAETAGMGAAGTPPPILFLNCGDQDTRELVPELYSRNGTAGGFRILHALTLWTAVRLQPDTVELASARPVLVTVKDPSLKGVVSALRAAGVEIVETDRIEPWHHSFFLWQMLFLPMAMCHSTYEYFLSFAEGREIAAHVIEEGLQTLERSGAQLRKLPVMDPQELARRPWKGRRQLTNGRFDPDRGYNSLLQALLRGEKTEVGELNERLVKRAAEVGVDASWNWRLARKLSRVVQVGFYRDPPELYQALS